MGPILPFTIQEAFFNESIFFRMELSGHVRYSVSREINMIMMGSSEQKMSNCGIVILLNASKSLWGILRSRESNATHLIKCTRMIMERTVNIVKCGLEIGGGTFR